MSNHEIGPHTRGESLFVGDLPDPPGLLHAVALASPIPHGRIVRLDTTPATEIEGVACILTAADIPGENEVGAVTPDQPLLPFDRNRYEGDAVAIVVAETERIAREAVRGVALDIRELPGVFDAVEVP